MHDDEGRSFLNSGSGEKVSPSPQLRKRCPKFMAFPGDPGNFLKGSDS